jgi:ubiquinone/menaquinone biosynthesis C-methylase UbiE
MATEHERSGRRAVIGSAANMPEPVQTLGRGSEDVISYYDRVAADWDPLAGEGINPIFVESRWRSLEPLLAPYGGAARAAELGVGTGVYIARTAPMFREIIAVDFSQGMLDVLQRKLQKLGISNVRPLREDACRMIGIADRSIDCAYSIGMLDNINEPARAFSEMARILRRGGGVVACTSNGRCPWFRLRDRLFGSKHHRTGRYLTEGEVRGLAAGAGLRFDLANHWGTVPSQLKSPALSRLLGALERPLANTLLARYFAGLTFRLIKP